MAEPTTTYVGGMYKTTDENGRVTFSDSPPNVPLAQQGGQQSNDGDTPVKSNHTKGMIYTEIVTDKITGKPVEIKRDANGKITPESQKELDKIQEARAEKILANERKIQEARDKVNAAKAADAANEKKPIGVSGEFKVTLPNGYEVINQEGSVGHKKTDTSVSVGVDLKGQAQKKVGQEHLPTPGVDLGLKVVVPEGTLIKWLGPKATKKVQWTDKEIEALKAEKQRILEQSAKDAIDGKDMSEINKARMSEIADQLREAGKRFGNEISK